MSNVKYDTAVIGGGPAGIIAAGTAAQKGLKVILLEKNKTLGRKLLITGKGRCNITNYETNIKNFIEKFGRNGKFLYPALNTFDIEKTLSFFNKYDLQIKIERGQRVFPVSDKSSDVLDGLLKFLKESSVNISTNTNVLEIINENAKIKKVITSIGEIIADKYIIAVGGLSYPLTGSTGDGYKWLKKLGHTIIEPKPALTPILCKEGFIKKLEGLKLKNVNASICSNNKKIDERFGEVYFTDLGIEGPTILDMSRKIGELLEENPALQIKIDLKPALDFTTLDKRILKDFDEQRNKAFKNSLNKLLPKQLIPLIIKLSEINPEKKNDSISKLERKKLVFFIKELTLNITGLYGYEKAIITAGGVKLSEIEPKTMKSKIFDNLYLAGEILDLDGPTGGYNLQVCWSTGYLAGISN